MTDDKEKPEKVQVLGVKNNGSMILLGENGDISSTTPMKAGVPVTPGSDIVELSLTDQPHVLTKKTIYKGKGPSKAATPKYREGYDRIFGKTPKKEDMN